VKSISLCSFSLAHELYDYYLLDLLYLVFSKKGTGDKTAVENRLNGHTKGNTVVSPFVCPFNLFYTAVTTTGFPFVTTTVCS
jgi:hypothetical protein